MSGDHHIHIKLADIERLEETFAVLTPHGWVIPDWLVWLSAITVTRMSATRILKARSA